VSVHPQKNAQFEVRGKFITKQPPKDNYDSENFWLLSSSRRRRRGERRGKGGEWREQGRAIKVNVGVDGAQSKIQVENNRGHECSAEGL